MSMSTTLAFIVEVCVGLVTTVR